MAKVGKIGLGFGTAAGDAPDAPSTPTLSVTVSGTTATVTVNGDAGVTNKVFYMAIGATAWILGGQVVGDGDVEIPDLAEGTQYVFVAESYNGEVSSDMSDPAWAAIAVADAVTTGGYQGDFLGDYQGVFLGGDAATSLPTATPESGTPTKLDKKLLPKIVKILNKLGKEAIFSVYTEAAYNPAIGKNAVGTASTYDKRIIPPYKFDDRYINGDLIKATDLITGVAGKDIGFEPVPGMKVSFDTREYSVLNMHPIYSGQQVALYLLHLRK